jgi:hypothetical protein
VHAASRSTPVAPRISQLIPGVIAGHGPAAGQGARDQSPGGVTDDGPRPPGASGLLDDGLHGRFGTQSAGVDRPAGQEERVAVLRICLIQRRAGGERLGRLEIVPDGLELTGFDRDQPARAPASRSARTGPASSASPAPPVAVTALRNLSGSARSYFLERLSTSDFASRKDVDGAGELPGAPRVAAELPRDPPPLEPGIGALA